MKNYLGIELGSTRIKAVVIDEAGEVLASGSFAWENRPLTETVWTYDLADARKGLAAAYAACADDYAAKFGPRPTRFDAMGVSAMMHGYIVFDRAMNQLAPFCTWRSTNAVQAGAELSAMFDFNVPIRWSIAQLYQSVLDGEAHVKAVFATLVKGMEILRAEGVYPTSLVGHGGLFKTPGVAEKILSDMLGIPVTTRATAGEGGAWGIARLASLRRL